jgi:hypothetical protein
MSRIEHRVTYDPNETRCSCGWVAKLGGEIHLISPHAVAMIAGQQARIAELEAEREAFVALAKTAQLKRNTLIRDTADFKGEWVAIPEEDFDALRNALAHPAVQEALKKEMS